MLQNAFKNCPDLNKGRYLKPSKSRAISFDGRLYFVLLYGSSHVKLSHTTVPEQTFVQEQPFKKIHHTKWKHKSILCDRIITKTNKLNYENTKCKVFTI